MKQENKYEELKIGTHNGIFHCDEVVAIAILKILFEDIKKISIIRTRNEEILKSNCNIIIDIGGGKFDHHQKEIKEKRINGIDYASAGLIWKEFGILVIKKFCNNLLTQNEMEEVFSNIDEKIIQNVDMEDNGKSFNYHPFMFINSFLPQWNEIIPDYDQAFENALKNTINILKQYIKYDINIKLGNKEIEARINSPNYRRNNILLIPTQTIPWIEKIVEYNNSTENPIDFVVFPYPVGGFALQCVPNSLENRFSQRISLPYSWAGETTNLPNITNIKSATFCHKGRFFARAENFDDIIMMCEEATYENEKLIKKLKK